MTPCEYRHDCWHEDTCCARESPLVKPGCWMPKGEGWRPEPDSVKEVSQVVKVEIEAPKEADQGELF